MMTDQHRDAVLSAQQLSLYAASESTAIAVEAERRRLAALLQDSVVEQLNLLVNKAARFEQMMGHNDEAQMTVSVLGNLARGVLQQARDLQANLSPTTLEALGLEPALERLVEQVTRASYLRVNLVVERLRERLPPQVELTLFRTAQDFLEYTMCDVEVTYATLRLETKDDWIVFTFSNQCADTALDGMEAVAWRVAVLGGQVETNVVEDGFELRIMFPIRMSTPMTEREMEVLHLLGEGLTNKQIAEQLVVSPRTINFHLDNIYTKLNVRTRTEAVVYAMRHNWLRRAAGTNVGR